MALWLGFSVFFINKHEYSFAVNDLGGGTPFLSISPSTAIALFNLPSASHTGPITSSTPRGWFVPSYSAVIAADIPNPNPSGVALLTTQDSVIVPGQAGSFGGPVGPSLEVKWAAEFFLVEPSLGVSLIPQRRWGAGLELAPTGEGGANIGAGTMCRDASRTIDGHGYPIRGATSSGVWLRNINEYRALTTNTSWERLYVRIRTSGATNCGIWRSHGSSSANAGGALKVNTDRTISAFNISATNVETLLGTTTALDLNKWYLIDIILRYNSGVNDGRLRVFLNHTLVIDEFVTSQGLAQIQNHGSSSLGKWTAAADAIVEIDLDDWICANVPTDGGFESLNSIDWLSGSHVRYQHHGGLPVNNWSPNNEAALNQGHNPIQELSSTITSTTSGGELRAQITVEEIQDFTGITLGAASTIVADHSTNAGGTDGQLGYNAKQGDSDVLAVIDQVVAPGSFHSRSYQPTGLLLPENLPDFIAIRKKSADANLDTIRMLASVSEHIGVWGPEDNAEVADIQRLGYLHNCRYVNTFWGLVGPLPLSPVFVVGGTYVGNGTTGVSNRQVNLPAPCHFLWIRPISGAPSGGVKWFGSGLGGNLGATDRVVPNMPVTVFVTSGLTFFQVSGNSIECNQDGVTYQYIAFCDPGMRFNLCGAYNHPAGAASPYTNNLIDNEFTSVGGFLQNQRLGITSNTIGLSYKGPGHGANDGNEIPGGSIAQWGSFGLGMLITRSGVHYANPGQVTYSLWRTSEPNCSTVMVQILTYTGNGVSPRNITLTPISGRFPLFALVMPHGASAFYRDPSHTGSNSANASTLANSTTAITGGAVDQITVSSSLNTNGVIYDVFVIPGDTAGWNNGTYFPPNCEPDDFTRPVPLVPQGVNVIGNGGVTLGASVAITVLKDVSGLYTLVDGKTNDTIYNRISGASTEVRKIPNLSAKTGFISG